MRILCVEQFPNLGGGQQSLLDLLPAFTDRGWSPRVLLPGRGPLFDVLQQRGYETDCLRLPALSSRRKPPAEMLEYAKELPRLTRAIGRLIDTHRINLIYVNGSRLLPPSAWAARVRRQPLVFHCHSRLTQSWALRVAGSSLRLANARVIGCCLHAAAPLRQYVSPERLQVLYNGVANKTGFRTPIRFPLRHIGVLGRVEPEKGQLEFVRAAQLVHLQNPACRFSIIGSPMFSGTDYYRQVVKEGSGLPIQFLGWQNDPATLFRDLDVLVVPSTPLEATTRVIPEAFAGGVPVVAFPSGGIPEILIDGENGFLAVDGTAEALADRVMSVLQMHTQELFAVVNRARQTWKDRYTLERYQQQVCDLIEAS